MSASSTIRDHHEPPDPSDETAVATPANQSEAPTRVNSLDMLASESLLAKLHAQVEKGDSTAIAEYEKLAHLHKLPSHEHLKHHDDRVGPAALEEGQSSPGASDAEEKQDDEREQVPAVMLTEDEDPTSWTVRRKWTTTALVSCLYFNATVTSSVGTGATAQYIQQFSVSHEVSALVLSIYMIGFCIGPPLWAPLSELYGRLMVNYISVPGYFFFNIGCALAPNVSTLLVCRFLVGLFAAAPQSNSGGTISDIWVDCARLWPMYTYSLSAFMGPTLGPLVGGFIAGSDVESQRWRWIYWLLCLLSVVSMALVLSIQKESYAPVLLRRKAERLRAETGRKDILAPSETLGEDGAVAAISISEILRVYVGRPFHMLFTEAPLMYATLWTSFCYAIIFMFFEAYPVVFSGIYGFNAGEVGLAFLAIGLGIALSAPIVGWFNKRSLAARIAARERLLNQPTMGAESAT